ncbi:MAG: hypothetical protein ACI4KE_03835 [Anaerovoracaceae bacterium]
MSEPFESEKEPLEELENSGSPEDAEEASNENIQIPEEAEASEEISAEEAAAEEEICEDSSDTEAETETDAEETETEAEAEELPEYSEEYEAEDIFEEDSETEDETEDELQQEERRPVNWKKVGRTLLNIASMFIMLFGVFLVLYYIWGPARNEFHSDSTDTLYWAEAAMQGNGLINPDFNYAAIMPLGGNLFMQIWIPFFGVSMMTHTLGMTTFFVLFTASLFWLLHEMKWSIRWKGITIGGMLMAVSLSSKLREIFWGHIIYYSLGMLFLLIGLCLVLHIYNLQSKPKTKSVTIQKTVFLVLLFVMFILCCTNSTTAIALFALPIVAALFCERFLDHSTPLKSKKTALCISMLVLCLVGVVLGMKLGSHIAGDVKAGYATAYSHFSATDTWWEHLEGLPLAFLNLNGLEVNPDYFLMSKEGINIIMLMAYVMMIVILPLAALFCYGKIKDTGTHMLIWSHFVSTAFILIAYICGGLSTANWRLSPLIVTGFILSIAFMRWLYTSSKVPRLGIVLLLPVAYVCLQCAISITKMPADSYLENTSYKLGQYLQEQGLEYGYATSSLQ